MSDRSKIREILIRNQDTWVCSSVFLREHFIKDYAQRISEIRTEKVNGFNVEIQGKTCDLHNHKQHMYKLSIIAPNYERTTLF